MAGLVFPTIVRMDAIPTTLRTGREARQAIRSRLHRGATSGLAPGYVQANLAIVPAAWAYDFLKFCQRNPKPCPLLGVGETGAVDLPELGVGIDIRRDLPGYRVWRDGRHCGDVADLATLWQDDWVSFAIGCSFSFEQALATHGIGVRNIEQGVNVSMFVTRLQTTPAGPFGGPVVVSMRPMSPADAIRAVRLTARYPLAHGAPLHVGDPAALGIDDLSRPDFGDPVELRDGEVPVFWACGVTPQAAMQRAALPTCVTHIPGQMLVTDLLINDLELR